MCVASGGGGGAGGGAGGGRSSTSFVFRRMLFSIRIIKQSSPLDCAVSVFLARVIEEDNDISNI
jgi:hypothetical protein